MRCSLKLEIKKLQAGCVNFENASGSGNATHGSMVKKCRSSGSDKAPGNADVIVNDVSMAKFLYLFFRIGNKIDFITSKILYNVDRQIEQRTRCPLIL